MYKCASSLCVNSELREEIIELVLTVHDEHITVSSEAMVCPTCRAFIMDVAQMHKLQNLTRCYFQKEGV